MPLHIASIVKKQVKYKLFRAPYGLGCETVFLLKPLKTKGYNIDVSPNYR